jgi:hypothetical protein
MTKSQTTKLALIFWILLPVSAAASVQHIVELPFKPMRLRDVIRAVCDGQAIIQQNHVFVRPQIIERDQCPTKR